MKRKTAMKGSLIFLSVLIGATAIPVGYAQQSSDLGMSGRQPDRETISTRASREASAPSSVASTWQAGKAEMTNSAKWGADQQGFAPAGSTVWTAGAKSFGASKQPGGIWSESHISGIAKAGSQNAGQPEMPAPLAAPTPFASTGLDLMASPTKISPPRTASLGKSRFQLSPGGRTGTSLGFPLAAGGPPNPFASKMQSTSRIGTGSKPGSKRPAAGSRLQLDSPLKDSFVLDDGLDSGTPQDSGPLSH